MRSPKLKHRHNQPRLVQELIQDHEAAGRSPRLRKRAAALLLTTALVAPAMIAALGSPARAQTAAGDGAGDGTAGIAGDPFGAPGGAGSGSASGGAGGGGSGGGSGGSGGNGGSGAGSGGGGAGFGGSGGGGGSYGGWGAGGNRGGDVGSVTISANSGMIQGGGGGSNNGGGAAGVGGGGGGSSVNGGGGGGGGGNAGNVIISTNDGTIRGGSGSGTGGGGAGVGGGGRASGAGGNAGSVTISTNSGIIQGGDGGSGGDGVGSGGGNAGGSGGAITGSIYLNNAGSGVVQGGSGAGSGTGGVGVRGANVTIINAGTIAGGLNGNGTQAAAIIFTGGANSLELQAGYTITGNVVAVASGSDTLILGGSTNANFDAGNIGASAQYQNFANFEKSGSSTWTLTDSTAEATPWTIKGGTLNVTGTMASSSMTVNAGTLTGTGIVGNTTIAAGGIFAPGNGTPGTAMTVSGNLDFAPGAQYVVSISPATSSLANVSGIATLSGATVNAIYANGSYVDRRYTILTATGGVDGTFSGPVNTNLPTNFSTALAYDGNNAYLDLTLNYDPGSNAPGPNFGGGLDINQRNVANTLVNYFNTTGGIPMAFGALSPRGLTQVSGELATAPQQAMINAANLFLGVMTDPFASVGPVCETDAYGAPRPCDTRVNSYASTARRPASNAFAAINKAPPFEQRWSVWASGFGGSQTTNGNAIVGSHDTTSDIYGAAIGADYWLSPATRLGFAMAGGGTNFRVSDGLGSGRSDLFQVGVYGRHTMGDSYLTGALAYGWQDVTTDRTLAIAGLDRLHGDFSANTFSGRLEAGHRYALGWIGVTPYVAGQFTTFDLPAYSEQALVGSNLFALNYDAKTATASRSELGLRTDRSIALADGMLTLRGRFAWAHNFDTDRSIAATFQTLPGASFVVNGAKIGADSALTSAAAELSWRNGWSVATTFDGEFSDVSTSYAGKGVLRYRW